MKNFPTDEYVPGLCNIGLKEIGRRKLFGWWMLAITFIFWLFLAVSEASSAWSLLLFIPASLSAFGFLQASFHFCAAFGLKGLFNFSTEYEKTETIKEVGYRAIDRRRAWQIIFYSALIGLVVALAGLF